MPTYSYVCEQCDTYEERILKVKDYLEPQTGQCGHSLKKILVPTMIISSEIDAYESPATGRMIYDRDQRKRDLSESGCRPWEGIQQERKHAQQQKAYEEQKTDAVLDKAIRTEYHKLSPEKRKILEKGE